MTRDQALRQAQKRWGKRAAIRAEGELSSPEKRAAAKERKDTLRSQKAELEAEITRREVAAGIPEVRAQIQALSKPITSEMWESMRYRFTVGSVDGVIGAFHVKGQGDTWEQAFDAADAKDQS